MPDDKEQLWPQAGQRLASGQRDDGRRFYRVFIQRFPAGSARARRRTWRSACRSSQESKYPNAAAEFQKVLTVYPSSPEVPEAMWQLSLGVRAAALLHRRARAAGGLVKRYPKSPRAADAKGELKAIAKLPKAQLHASRVAAEAVSAARRSRRRRATLRGRRRSGSGAVSIAR